MKRTAFNSPSLTAWIICKKCSFSQETDEICWLFSVGKREHRVTQIKWDFTVSEALQKLAEVKTALKLVS